MCPVNATEIIEEIKHLPPDEQREVLQFVRTLEASVPWSPGELSEAASRLASEGDVIRARELRDRIVAGFYGE